MYHSSQPSGSRAWYKNNKGRSRKSGDQEKRQRWSISSYCSVTVKQYFTRNYIKKKAWLGLWLWWVEAERQMSRTKDTFSSSIFPCPSRPSHKNWSDTSTSGQQYGECEERYPEAGGNIQVGLDLDLDTTNNLLLFQIVSGPKCTYTTSQKIQTLATATNSTTKLGTMVIHLTDTQRD